MYDTVQSRCSNEMNLDTIMTVPSTRAVPALHVLVSAFWLASHIDKELCFD